MRFIFLVTVLVTCACSFQPDGITFHEVSQNPGITKFSIPGAQDTLLLYGKMEINVDVDFGNREVYDISFFLNEQEINIDSYTLYSYNFDSKDFADGIYVLTLSYQVKSNTNSLADQLEAEILTVELKQIAVVDNKPLQPLEIVALEPANGSLQIVWDRYDGRGFERYAIGSLIDIDQQTINRTLIPGYAGGKIYDNLSLFAKGENIRQPFEYFDDLGFGTTQSFEGIYTFSWSSNPYYNEFKNYTIELFDAISRNYVVEESINNINTQEYLFDPLYFPSRHQVKFFANNYEVQDTTIGSTFFKYPVGYSGHHKVLLKDETFFTKGVMNNSIADQVILRYDFKTGQLLDELHGIVDVTNDGERLAHHSGGIISLIESNTMEITASIDLSQYPEINQVRTLIADDQKMAIIDSNHTLFIFDIADEKIIKTFNFIISWPSPAYRFSASHNYLYANGNDVIDLIDGAKISLQDRVFDPINERIIEFGDGVALSFNMSFTESKEFSLGYSYEFPYSFSAKHFSLIIDEPGDLSIKYFNMTNGSLVGSIAMNPETFVHRSSYFVTDDLICYINRRGELGLYVQKLY